MSTFTVSTQAGLGTDKVRTARVSTGSIAGAAQVSVTFNWPTPFADSNYTVSVSVVEAQVSNTLEVLKVVGLTPSAVEVRVINNDAVTARTGTLHAIAIHD